MPADATSAPGTAPDALFDLAVNRAATTLHGLGLPGPQHPKADAALQEWHARTRFARRVPLADVQARLASHPALHAPDVPWTGWHWAGGPDGAWRPGRAPFP
ncbi:hypothetical protein [Deinococcus aquiradiocola]|uniref:Uncharacterized protein n=1 Tax=Deinococcus aquiradiocola TaxID=393059 RepID=A0A917UQ90_9DEIO|nr:hypothetical protein [Deinococcus aquiradiocola]GGJ74451.1 hypothetical protein GCM10008939_18470 [Deinococcus aquiradiocola]